MTIHYYKSGSTYVAVETRLPGQGFMQVVPFFRNRPKQKIKTRRQS